MSRKLALLLSMVLLCALATLGVPLNLANNSTPVASAAAPVPEMDSACVQTSNGKMSFRGNGACASNETRIVISNASPTLACAQDVDKKLFRVTSAAQCSNPSILLTLPNPNSATYLCAKNSNGDLRYVLGPSECKNNETAVVVPRVNRPPTDISLSNSSVAENQPAGTTVGTFTTTDPDTGNTHTYTLVGGVGADDNASFQITGASLKTGASFNFETKSSYSIRVRTTDNGGLWYEEAFAISVTNVNEAPSNISLSSNSVNEDAPVGSTIGTFTTDDEDTADTHAYTLVAGTGSADNSSFQLVGNELRSATAFDYEAKSSYNIRVRSTDNGGLFTEKAFTITITDDNDPPNNISLSNSTVAENQPAGTTVGTFSTSDPDAGDTHTYTLISGAGADDNASFQIDGSTLKTAAPLDFDAKSSYSIRVETKDLFGSTFEKTFTITVTNVNEAPSEINLSSSSVAENEPSGTTVGTFTSDDQDAGDTHTYTLVAGTGSADNGSFQVVDDELQTAASFNFETKSSYSIRVRTTDNGGLSYEEAFTISVTNVNEAPVNSVPGAQTVDEDTDIVFSSANGNAISISDPDSNPVKVSIGVFSGTLTLASTTGLTFEDGTSNGQKQVNVSGSIANINAALNGLRYIPNQNFNSTRGLESLAIVTNDQDTNALVDMDSVGITVNAVNDRPQATAKSFAAHTNMPISLGGLLAGASDPADADDAGYTPSFTLVDVVVDNCTGCTISNVDTTNDTFDFSPPPGGVGSYTLKYRVADSGNPAPGADSNYTTITITVSGPVVWFVDPNAPTNGDGRLGTPFNNLAAADAVDAANHRVFVYAGTATSGLALNQGEWLIGQGVSEASFDEALDVNPPSGTHARPAVGSGTVTLLGSVGLNDDAVVRAVDITVTGATTGMTGTGATGVRVDDVSILSTGGTALSLSSTSGTLSFGSVSANGTAPGVVLTNNTGATITFAGGLTLVTGASNAFSATGGGTVTVTGANNTLVTTTGVALNVSNTTIGAGGLTFRSVTVLGSNTAPAQGIKLQNTGSSGGLTITGNTSGACGSAAFELDCSGGTISGTSVDGILLNNTAAPSLTRVNVKNNRGNGIKLDGVSGFSLSHSHIAGNADSASLTEAGIYALNLSGSNTIASSTVKGSFVDNVLWEASSGTATLSVTGSTVGPTGASNGRNGISLRGSNTANATLNVSGSSFPGNRGTGVIVSAGDTSAVTADVGTSNFTDNGGAVSLTSSLSADLTFDVHDNPTILGSGINAIQVLGAAGSTSNSQVRGKVRNNVIGDNTVNSGSQTFYGIAAEANNNADMVLSITGNTIKHTDWEGIRVEAREATVLAGQGLLDVTIRDNSISNIDDNTAFPLGTVYGLLVDVRNDYIGCADIAANTSTHVGGGATDFRLRQRNTSTFKLERYVGAGTNTTLVAAHVVAENPYVGSSAEATVQGATGFTGVANGTCRKP